MNTRTLLLAAGAAMLIAGAAQAGTLTLIAPDPLASSTSVLGINNAGWMTGSAIVGGQELGYLRDPTGTYTTFSVNTTTFGRGIDNANNVIGYGVDSTFQNKTDNMFVRASNGTVTTVVDPSTSAPLHGIAQNANGSGAIVGSLVDSGGVLRSGFVLDGSTLTTLMAPGSSTTQGRGIEDDGTVAGYATIAGQTQGFVLTGGVYSIFQDPNATAGNEGTFFENINNNGLTVGLWKDSSGNDHAFEFNAVTKAFTEIEVAGFTSVDAFGVNDHGDVVLEASNADRSANFVFNAAGVPEPASWAMMLTGFFGLGSMLRRRRAVLAV